MCCTLSATIAGHRHCNIAPGYGHRSEPTLDKVAQGFNLKSIQTINIMNELLDYAGADGLNRQIGHMILITLLMKTYRPVMSRNLWLKVVDDKTIRNTYIYA